MTKDDIIRMAVKCQLITTGNRGGIYADALEAFANLAAAHEREACALICEPQEEHDDPLTAWKIAAAIRARANNL